MFKFFNKKIIVSVLIVCMLSGFLSPIFAVKKAQAQFIVELGPVALSFFSTAFPLSMAAAIVPALAAANATAQTAATKTMQQIISIILESFRLRLLDFMVQTIVDFIVSGPNGGKPQFILNAKNLLNETAVDAAATFLSNSKYAGLCEPFSFKIRASLIGSNRINQHACTLDMVVGNIRAFYNDFREGGWIGFSTMLGNENNFYGAMMEVEAERMVELYSEITNTKSKIDTGEGMAPTEKCGYTYDSNHDGVSQASECIFKKITTPGSAIAGQLQDALGVNIKGILSAKEFTTYIAWIINSVVFRLFQSGVSGLFGMASGGGGGGWNPPQMPGVAYACIQGSCSAQLSDETANGPSYSTLEICENNCANNIDNTGGEVFDVNPLACPAGGASEGVFLRGRPANDCEGGLCNRCTGVGGETAQNCCTLFCIQTKDVEWGKNNPATFSAEDIAPLCSFFSLSVPNECVCNNSTPAWDDTNKDIGKFKNCSGCDEKLIDGFLCRQSMWCENQAPPVPSDLPEEPIL